ncbi:unnamed protein product [Trichobilharzia szidati]|nr:unnamed protein product [Trichobilharzia szidati]
MLIEKNIEHNKVSKIVSAVCSDANDLMYQHRKYSERFNVVDIDPFGTASPFLDSAVQCLHNGGLLCVTSTDMAVLCGSTPGTAMGKYGGMAIKTSSTHEVGLRILLNGIQSAASRYGKIIEPLLSLSVDFYARIFARVWSSPISVKAIAAKHGICYTCPGCLAYYIQPLGEALNNNRAIAPARGPPVGPQCTYCGSKFNVFGPMWIGPLHSRSFLYDFLSDLGYPPGSGGSENHSSQTTADKDEESSKLPNESETQLSDQCNLVSNKHYGTIKRIVGMATMAYEELPDVPLYYAVDQLASLYGCTIPKLLELHSCFLNANYRVSCSHADKNSLKTDAPHSFVLDCFRVHYEKLRELKNSNQNSDSEEHSKEVVETLEKTSIRDRRRARRKRSCNDNAEDEDISYEPNSGEDRKTVRASLLTRPINPSVSFTCHPLANPPSRNNGLLRYQVNPEKHWGPKSKRKNKVASPQ